MSSTELPKEGELIAPSQLRQGFLISAERLCESAQSHLMESRAVIKERTTGLGQNDILLVLSQDCDIASTNNPYVELLTTKRVASRKADNKLQVPRNYSKIYLPFEDCYLECKIKLISMVEKEALGDEVVYEGALDDRSTRILLDWHTGRYRRTPLPDAFNRIFKPFLQESGLDQFLEQHYTDIEDLWVYIFPETENVGGPYDVSVTAQLSPECKEDTAQEIDARLRHGLYKFLDNDTLNFGQINNGEWIHEDPPCSVLVTARSEDISLLDLFWLRRFNTDYLCYPEEGSEDSEDS